MTYDIYGNPLRRGYCEVHPDVAEEYPCYQCLLDEGEKRRKQPEQQPEPDFDEHIQEMVEQCLSDEQMSDEEFTAISAGTIGINPSIQYDPSAFGYLISLMDSTGIHQQKIGEDE